MQPIYSITIDAHYNKIITFIFDSLMNYYPEDISDEETNADLEEPLY